MFVFFLSVRQPPITTRHDTRLSYTTLFRSATRRPPRASPTVPARRPSGATLRRWRLCAWRSISRWRTAGATARAEPGRRWAVVRIAGRRATRAACDSLLQAWVRPGPEEPPRCRPAKPAGKGEPSPAATPPGDRRRRPRPERQGGHIGRTWTSGRVITTE